MFTQDKTPVPKETADPGILDSSKFDPHRPLAQELQPSVPDGFTVVAVGDCITSRPLSQLSAKDPEFAQAISLLRSGDVTYGNMETSILDLREFHGYPYAGPDDVTLVADPAVATDLKSMGFSIVSRANNHALDWGVDGMRETSRWLNDAGIAYGGVVKHRAWRVQHNTSTARKDGSAWCQWRLHFLLPPRHCPRSTQRRVVPASTASP